MVYVGQPSGPGPKTKERNHKQRKYSKPLVWSRANKTVWYEREQTLNWQVGSQPEKGVSDKIRNIGNWVMSLIRPASALRKA